MLLNLSGAHCPCFARRNILILDDSRGHVGVAEVPGGEGIRQTLEDARPLVMGQLIGRYNYLLEPSLYYRWVAEPGAPRSCP
jgi:glucarate dehydratase